MSLLALPAHAALVGGTLEISGAGCRFPDVAYGSVSRQFLVVWADYNGVPHISGRLVRGDGSYAGGVFAISDADKGSLYPAVAFNPGSNEFLVTWDDTDARGGVIVGQRVRGSDGALMGTNFVIGAHFGGIRSAVAWSPPSACYLVTYFVPGAAAEIFGQRVSSSGSPLGPNFNISNDAIFSGYPAVAWGATSNEFLVTWDNEDGNIHARRVNAATGALVGTTIIATTGGAKDRSCVTYDSVNSRWFVQFNNNANAGFSYDQYAQLINPNGTLFGAPLPIAHTSTFEGDTQFGGDVAFEPASRRFFSSFGTDTGMGGQESLASGASAAPQTTLGTGYYTSLNNAADSHTHRFLTAWEGLVGTFRIFGQLYAPTLGVPLTFNAESGDTQNLLTWRNPSDPHFAGTTIRMRQDAYPTGPADGALVIDQLGAPGALQSFTHTGLPNWTTYYYAAFARDDGTNHSPAAQATAIPRPPAVTVSSSAFDSGPDGWTLDVWRAGTGGFGSAAWDPAAHNILSTGNGASNNRDTCTREGTTISRLIPTAGRSSIQIEYDVMAALYAPPGGTPAGNCTNLEGTLEDKLVLSFSTTGTNGPWILAQTLTEGIELPTDWTRQTVNLAGVPAVTNNSNFALRFQWQFNSGFDTGRIDNVRILSGAVTAPGPMMRIAPTSIELTTPSNFGPAPATVKVSNTGGGALTFSVTSDSAWLLAFPPFATTSGPEQVVTLTFCTPSLAPDDYSGNITFASAQAANSPMVLPVALRVLPPACFWEPFTYYPGNLTTMGSANWTGLASNQMTLRDGALELTGGSGSVEARRTLSCSGSGGVIVAQIKIRGGTGSGDFFWSVYFDDPTGASFARWYGGTRIARGRIGSSITADMPLTGGPTWDDLYLQIDTAANTTEFFFNGISYGTINHGPSIGATISAIRFERFDRPTTANETVTFDNLTIGALDQTPPRLLYTRSGPRLSLTWPAIAHGATLQTKSTLSPQLPWTRITNSVAVTNGSFLHETNIPSGRALFRLQKALP